VHLVILNASTPSEIEAAFAIVAGRQIGALLVGNGPFFPQQRDQLTMLAARHAVPTMYPDQETFSADGFMSYGARLSDAWRVVGSYTGRILKGEKPADLPVQQVTKIELAINLKTAKALGLTVPLALLTRADEVIE
jgi:putative ABC transport system substrate-binding protein